MVRKYEKETGIDSVQQAYIVNKMIEKLELEEGGMGTNLERAE